MIISFGQKAHSYSVDDGVSMEGWRCGRVGVDRMDGSSAYEWVDWIVGVDKV